MKDAILSSALAKIGKAGKSVRWVAARLDKLEVDLRSSKLAVPEFEGPEILELREEYEYSKAAEQAHAESVKRFGLVGGEKGGLRSRLLKTTLTAATQYVVSNGGVTGGCSDMVRLAWTCSRAELIKHENELVYLKEELRTLKEMTTTTLNWRQTFESWQATLALLKSVAVERGSAVLQCIASDEKLLQALGMAMALFRVNGEVPTDLVIQLNDNVGAHIRTHAYKYDKLISQELVRIQRVKDIQWKAVTLGGSSLVATMIGAANLLSRLYYDVLESGDTRLAVRLPAGAVALLLLLLLCCCTYYRYHHRSLARGAGRLRGKCCGGKFRDNKAAAKAEVRPVGP